MIRNWILVVLLAGSPTTTPFVRGASAAAEVIAFRSAPQKKAAPAPRAGSRAAPVLGHLGGFGLFLVAMLDSSPVPTFGGLDILTAVLAARHRQPWFYYAATATAGSLIGAYMTFKAARKAGTGYLEGKFGKRRVAMLLDRFQHWGTGALAVSAAVPFPFPTSFFFAAAGAMNYSLGKFLVVAGACRAVRYATIALVASLYGRHFVRALRHPGQYYGWLIGIALVVVTATVIGLLVQKRLQTTA